MGAPARPIDDLAGPPADATRERVGGLPDDLVRAEAARAGQRLLWFVAASWLVVPLFALPAALAPHTQARALMILGWGLAVLVTPAVLGWWPGRGAAAPDPRRLRLAGHWFVGATLASLAVETAFFGGLRAASSFYIPLLPGLAVLLAGRGAAWPWAIACGAVTVAACVLDVEGMLRPEELDRTESLVNAAGTMLLGVFLAAVLARTFEGQKQEALTQLAEERARFAWQALHDGLTGLPNRTLLEDRLRTALARGRRSGDRVAVVYLDLDGFKAVNDAGGHAAGDALLCRVAREVGAVVRASDTLARVGGDEFVVVAEGLRGAKDAAVLVRKVRGALADTHAAASLGVAVSPDDGETPDALFEAADAAMYREKSARRAAVRHPVEQG